MSNGEKRKAYEDDTRGHVWIKAGDKIDIFAYEEGDNHNGPRCAVCGYGFCHHCYGAMSDADCNGSPSMISKIRRWLGRKIQGLN